jgi:hypothetical protein
MVPIVCGCSWACDAVTQAGCRGLPQPVWAVEVPLYVKLMQPLICLRRLTGIDNGGRKGENMRTAAGTLLTIVAVSVMGLMFYALWQQEHGQQPLNFAQEHRFPLQRNVTEIAVINRDGAAARPAIQDPGEIADIFKSLAAAPQDYFGDPERSGTLYRVEIRRVSGKSSFYEINDLRGMGSSVSGKIYPVKPGREDVWRLSPDLIRKLVQAD